MNWQAFLTSIQLAAATAIILMVIALPLSYWIAYSKWRWKFLVEAVVALPLVLPPRLVTGRLVLGMLLPQGASQLLSETIVLPLLKVL